MTQMTAKAGERLTDALNTQKYPKFESYAKVKAIKDELKKELPAGDPHAGKKLTKYFELLRENIFRDQVLNDRIRPDHRAFDEIRHVTNARPKSCRAFTVLLCSRAAKPRRWFPPRWAPQTTHSAWKATRARSEAPLHAALQLSAVLGW